MTKLLKALFALLGAIALIAFGLGVYATMKVDKVSSLESTTKEVKASTSALKADVGKLNVAVSLMKETIAKTDKNVADLSESTRGTLESARDHFKIVDDKLVQIEGELQGQKTQADSDRKEIESANQLSKDSVTAVQVLGRQMRDDLATAIKNLQVQTAVAAVTTEPAKHPPIQAAHQVQIQVPTPTNQPVQQPLIGNVTPVGNAFGSKMIRIGTASANGEWKFQEVAAGVESRKVKTVGKPDGWVAADFRGQLVVWNHVRVKDGVFRGEVRHIQKTINPGEPLPVFSDADEISIVSENGPATLWWRER